MFLTNSSKTFNTSETYLFIGYKTEFNRLKNNAPRE